MNKEAKINFIKSVIGDLGEFTPQQVEHTAPVVSTSGEITYQLAERFYEHKVEVVTYQDESYIDTDYIPYEELEDHIIAQIVVQVSDWNTANMY